MDRKAMLVRAGGSLLALAVLLAVGGASAAEAAGQGAATPTVEQIIERNVAARGGLEAWRNIRAMRWSGHLDSAGDGGSLLFALDQARPNRTRFEIENLGQKSVRAFDGVHGWKLHPSKGIRPDVKPFSKEEDLFAKEAEVIDGPLIDHAVHGNSVRLGDLEEVQGRKAWRIIVTRASGAQEVVWVDAETWLELRDERVSYRSGGSPVVVTVNYRDYREFGGVQIPTVMEIGGAEGTPANRMRIEQVTLNPPLDEHAFESPDAVYQHRGPRLEHRRPDGQAAPARDPPMPKQPAAPVADAHAPTPAP